jgi:hypothetical protein
MVRKFFLKNYDTAQLAALYAACGKGGKSAAI